MIDFIGVAIFLILPFLFVPYAIKQYAIEYRNMRLIFMGVVATLFFLGAMASLFTDQGADGIDVITTVTTPAWNLTGIGYVATDNFPQQVGILNEYPEIVETETVTLINWCPYNFACIPTFLVVAFVYAGMAVVFTVLAISEAFILVLSASQKRRGEM